MNRRTLDLPQSTNALDSADFERILVDELREGSDMLPLEWFSREGGWPDDDTLRLRVSDMADVRGKRRVTILLTFVEIIPTGCSDIKRNGNCTGSLDIWLDPDAGLAYIEYDKDDR